MSVTTAKRAISLFSGAGGDTLGLERAGYQVVAYNEFNAAAIKTHQVMFPSETMKLLANPDTGATNITKVPDSVFVQYRGNVNLVFAGFPCQGFSHAGKKRANDSRNELVYEFARVVNLVQPEWILGENVKGLLSRVGFPRGAQEQKQEQQPVIQIICELFESIGYKMTYSVVDASLLGIPQNRKRLLLVGHRGDLYPHIPWPQPQPVVCPRSFFEPHLIGAIELPQIPYAPETRDPLFWIHTTATEPTGTPHPNLVRLVQGIRNMSGKEKEKQKQNANASVGGGGGGTVVEPGGLVSFGVRKGGYHGMVLHPDKPCNTIISTYNLCPRLFVGLHNPATPGRYWVRCMTPKELGQIQGFPADYPWQGSEKEQIIQIGNAVPPKMVEVVVGLLPFAEFKEMSQGSISESEFDSDSGSGSGSL